MIQLRVSPSAIEPNMGTLCAIFDAKNVRGYPRAILPVESVTLYIGIDPCPTRYTRKDLPIEHYPPVEGEERGQRGVLVGDSPQIGSPQPPQSLSALLRVASHGNKAPTTLERGK